MRFALRPLAIPLLLGGVAGCGSSHASPGPALYARTHPQIIPTASGHPDALYVPDPIRVQVGQAITWTNRDTDPHDVTADGGAFFSGPIARNGSYRWIPTRPGRFTYSCTLHPEMHGVVIVTS